MDATSSELRPIDDPERAYALTAGLVPNPATATADIPDVYGNECHVPQKTTTVKGPHECIYGDPQGSVYAVLIGDSKASQWVPALDAIGQREGWRIQVLAKSGCPFSTSGHYSECLAHNKALLERLQLSPPDLVITSTGTHKSSSVVQQFQAFAFQRLIVIDDNQGTGSGPLYECIEDQGLINCDFPRTPASGRASTTALAETFGTPLIEMGRWICPTAPCPPAVGNVLTLRQGSHLTNTYVRTLAPILHREMIAAGVARGEPLPLDPIR